MGYFGSMYDWNQSSRDDMYDRYVGRREWGRYVEDKEQVDWAFEEKDYEFDEA